ncbi:MAG: NTP transferase domain-containing protein [Xanthomonadales bacterium]|nr:hypothetical protein [Xanthomonadales bacterium]MCC6591773.1 NTP transferase domain-containing protein [Xanthomonadales bacterium]MCE7930037.1 phosphocholine cytidylyltransferase family protein [Xanthomonadales bacterium PRO6]
MNLVVLAAGRGSRLGAQADARPKCLTPLLGRPWLDHQLDTFAAAGLGPPLLVCGHAAAALQHWPRVARRVLQPRWAQSGPVASLHAALAHVADAELIVAYGDCLWHPQWLRWLRAARAPVALTVDREWADLWTLRFQDPLADAESLRMAPAAAACRHRRLLAIGARAARIEQIEAQFMGLLRFDAAGCARLRAWLDELPTAQRERLDITAMLARWLAEGWLLEAIVGGGAWLELDHASDLELYERALAQGFGHDWREPPR